jgi:hypothetical protein
VACGGLAVGAGCGLGAAAGEAAALEAAADFDDWSNVSGLGGI